MINPKEIKDRLDPALNHLREELANIRTNRPTPKLIENIRVAYLDQTFAIKQLGSIGIQPPREIHVSCWDPASAPAVASAIEASGLGVTASPDGSLVRVVLPALTDERRVELLKLVKKIAEEERIRIRSIRDELNKGIEAEFKAKALTEDQKFKSRELVQKNVDGANAEIEKLVKEKAAELGE